MSTQKADSKLIQTHTTLADEYKDENACADIHFGKDEHFIYGSNRGENTIVTFKVGSDGKIAPQDVFHAVETGQEILLLIRPASLCW